MAHTTKGIRDLLAATSVNTLHTPKGEVIVVSSSEKPLDAFKVLAVN